MCVCPATEIVDACKLLCPLYKYIHFTPTCVTAAAQQYPIELYVSCQGKRGNTQTPLSHYALQAPRSAPLALRSLSVLIGAASGIERIHTSAHVKACATHLQLSELGSQVFDVNACVDMVPVSRRWHV